MKCAKLTGAVLAAPVALTVAVDATDLTLRCAHVQ
jgi:hypothetical protein